MPTQTFKECAQEDQMLYVRTQGLRSMHHSHQLEFFMKVTSTFQMVCVGCEDPKDLGTSKWIESQTSFHLNWINPTYSLVESQLFNALFQAQRWAGAVLSDLPCCTLKLRWLIRLAINVQWPGNFVGKGSGYWTEHNDLLILFGCVLGSPKMRFHELRWRVDQMACFVAL